MAAARRLSSSKSSRFFVDSPICSSSDSRLAPNARGAAAVDSGRRESIHRFRFRWFLWRSSFNTLYFWRCARPAEPNREKYRRKAVCRLWPLTPLALTLLTSPRRDGRGHGCRLDTTLWSPMGFGGPHAAYFATREEFKRSLPGRLVGVSVDSRGDTAYRLRFKLESSTFDAKRRRLISALRKCFSPSCRQCTRFTMAPMGCAISPAGTPENSGPGCRLAKARFPYSQSFIFRDAHRCSWRNAAGDHRASCGQEDQLPSHIGWCSRQGCGAWDRP